MRERLNSSKKTHFIILGAMFGIMLVFNVLTQLLADDFQYSFNFATGKPITSFKESIDSIIAHGKMVNGRYFAHYIAQMCLLLPSFVFDLINSAVFVASVYMIYAICNRNKATNNTLLVGIFGFVWLFVHDFGQVSLWLDGSCNYLFAVFFGLLYFWPFMSAILFKKPLSFWLILPHLILSFWFGGYLEMSSVGFIGAAILVVLVDVFYYKNYRSLWFVPSILASFAGLGVMMLAPAQTASKMSEFSIVNTLTTFGVALLMVLSIFPIIILYVIFFKRALKEKMDRRILAASLAIVLGALASNFVLVLGRYYALRCSFVFVVMSIFATALIYANLENRDFGVKAKKFHKLFIITFALALTVGLADNIVTYSTIKQHEQIMAEAIENGETEVELRRPVPLTKYNGLWGLRYLDINDPYGWPNEFFARYYGFERVSGTSVFGDLFNWW